MSDPIGAARLRLGVGDRVSIQRDGRTLQLVEEARSLGLPIELLSIWLPRGWQPEWLGEDWLARLARRGVTPVVLHHFFHDGISRERVEAERDAWHADLERLARLAHGATPVLVVLEPEFNDRPPPGETAVLHWRGFPAELRRAVSILRAGARNARVGVSVGDFSPDRDFEPALDAVAAQLDFLGFSEMRAKAAPDAWDRDVAGLGRAAVDFARHLDDRFGRPVLLTYVAVSSYGGWEQEQARAIGSLADHARELERAGVFGVSYFQLFDDPDHAGYFGRAEQHFGLLRASGQPKPALHAFRRLGRQVSRRSPRASVGLPPPRGPATPRPRSSP